MSHGSTDPVMHQLHHFEAERFANSGKGEKWMCKLFHSFYVGVGDYHRMNVCWRGFNGSSNTLIFILSQVTAKGQGLSCHMFV